MPRPSTFRVSWPGTHKRPCTGSVKGCHASEGRCYQPSARAWLSYLADLSLAEDDHQWQALLQWKTPGAGNGGQPPGDHAPGVPGCQRLGDLGGTAGLLHPGGGRRGPPPPTEHPPPLRQLTHPLAAATNTVAVKVTATIRLRPETPDP